MLKEFDKFIGVPYKYENGPLAIQHLDQAKKEGLNCVALVHLVYKEIFKIILPANLQAIEMYFPNDHFVNLDEGEPLQLGDIIFVGRDNISKILQEYKPQFTPEGNLLKPLPLHVAIHLGNQPQNEPRFLHANAIDRGVGIWTECRMKSYVRYCSIYGRKRYFNSQINP